MATNAPKTQAAEAAIDNGKTIEVPPVITVRELADLMEVSPIEIIKELMSNGIMANINQQIDYETAAIVAQEMGFEQYETKSIIIVPEKPV